jgi:predicted signal transduction protein with EAL and GGDEF domain
MGDAGSDVSETSRTPIWRSMRPNGAAAAVIDFFDPCMKDAVEARRGLESALRAALALEEFSLVYQPQVDLATATVTGFEALLRWTRSDGTAVTPASFITWAGAIGRMPAIGEWVLRTATRDAAS